MTMTSNNWVPDEHEIDEALSLYDSWLVEAYQEKGNREEAFFIADSVVAEHPIHKTFSWLTENTPDRIYDIDEALPEE